MAGYVVVGLSIALVVLGISILGPIMAPAAASSLGINVDGTALTLYFLIFATGYNAILLSTIALHDRNKHSIEGESENHLFSLIIPCRNEEAVIEPTVRALMKVNYPKQKVEVLVVNDGSKDNTGAVVSNLQREFENLLLLNVPIEDSGRGKSAALNKAFEYLQKVSTFRDNRNWIIGVFDADGVASEDILRKASFSFEDQKTGAVQTLVRINNFKESILTMLQDIEFVTFAKVTQFARSIFKGAVALGGNGQFVRATALVSVALGPGQYWKTDALTEDLDLGSRILMGGWENAFLSTTSVYQHGVTTLSALYKQRTRWSWGSLQCFVRYALDLKVVRSKIGIVRKADLMYYLSAAILPPLILLVWTLSILTIAGLVITHNPFPEYFMVANSISFFPLIGYGLWTVRREYKARLIIPLLILTNAYTYHWVLCTMRAMGHMIKRDKPRWVVTKKRVVEVGPRTK